MRSDRPMSGRGELQGSFALAPGRMSLLGSLWAVQAKNPAELTRTDPRIPLSL